MGDPCRGLPSAFDEPAQVEGTILAVFAEEGDVVPCLDPVCVIGEEGEDISALVPAGVASEEAAAPAEEKTEAVAAPAAEAVVTVNSGERVFISPRAKNLALKTGNTQPFKKDSEGIVVLFL